MKSNCVQPADIYLPNSQIDLKKWAVVACDQYTSQPDYWQEVKEYVGEDPSSLKIMMPEALLFTGSEEGKIKRIHQTMGEYLAGGILEPQIQNGFILVERFISNGTRLGLVGKLDLERYDYDPEKPNLIRATEQTVLERIPPRLKIRQEAPLEMPHVLIFMDDPQGKLLESLYADCHKYPVAYETALMQGGKYVRGYALTGDNAREVEQKITQLQDQAGECFLIVGDGNHSLATAKEHWEQLKTQLPAEAIENHPARYTLVELVNIHSLSIRFEPIHRFVTNCSLTDLVTSFVNWLKEKNIQSRTGNQLVFRKNQESISLDLDLANDELPLYYLQKFLDEYLKNHPECCIDYIHGDQTLENLAASQDGCGILLQPLGKSDLFSVIKKNGVLPRKTFSIGEAEDKRFYIEARKIAQAI